MSAALAWSGLLYLLFVVYGSLVPLDFHGRPLSEAWAIFREIRYLALGIDSRADWVANVLLFVPLPFLWLGALWPARGRGRQLALSVVIATASIVLSVAIEFTQVFFPQRTVSINDIVAEAIGAGVGLVAWWGIGPRLVTWLEGWRRARGASNVAERILYVYVAGLLVYSVMPLDLTISPVDLYHKWQAGRVVLAPFTGAGAEGLYGLTTDVLMWIPVSALWVLSARRAASGAWLWTVATAALVEAAQLFVYTRVSDITDVVLAVIGAAIGAGGAAWLRSQPVVTSGPSPRARRLGPALAVAGAGVWLVVLVAVFWAPYDFRTDRAFLVERVGAVRLVPFTAYYFSSEYRALTELLRKTLFFVPLGVAVAVVAAHVRGPLGRRLFVAAAVVLVALVAISLEVGKLLLPTRYPDTANVVLETCAAALACWGVMAWRRSDA